MHGYATYPQGFGVPVPNEETLGEFRFAAWATRSMAEAWHAFQHAESDRAAYDAGVLIEQWLSAALWPFGPTVDLVDAAHDRPILAPYVSLYSICALQLFNHMARGEVWRQCANETCSQLFVHQAGRAEFRQHRLHGVKFHSAACAQAQAQREYRRRKKERR